MIFLCLSHFEIPIPTDGRKKNTSKLANYCISGPSSLKSFLLKGLISEIIKATQNSIPMESASFLPLPKAASGFKGYFSILKVE